MREAASLQAICLDCGLILGRKLHPVSPASRSAAACFCLWHSKLSQSSSDGPSALVQKRDAQVSRKRTSTIYAWNYFILFYFPYPAACRRLEDHAHCGPPSLRAASVSTTGAEPLNLHPSKHCNNRSYGAASPPSQHLQLGQALVQGQALGPGRVAVAALGSSPPGASAQPGPEGALLQLGSFQVLAQGLELLHGHARLLRAVMEVESRYSLGWTHGGNLVPAA